MVSESTSSPSAMTSFFSLRKKKYVYEIRLETISFSMEIQFSWKILSPLLLNSLGSELDLDFPITEAQAFENDLSGSKHCSAVRLNAGAGVGRADDGGDIQLDQVTEPTVSPSTKDEQAAAFDIKSPGTVLTALGCDTMIDRRRTPDLDWRYK